jgi:hypothetical protein
VSCATKRSFVFARQLRWLAGLLELRRARRGIPARPLRCLWLRPTRRILVQVPRVLSFLRWAAHG